MGAMITRITGRLAGVEGNAAEVEPLGPGGTGAGLAYEVLVPTYLAERLAGRVGEEVTLWTRQMLEGQSQGTSFVPRLIGFGSPRERRFFELFTSVKGLGVRKALRALADEPGNIAAVIVGRDARALTRLPEIGAKLAQQIVMDLHVKAGEFAEGIPGGGASPTGPETKPRGKKKPSGRVASEVLEGVLGGRGARSAAAPAAGSPAAQAVRALTTLGEQPAEAERMVTRALAEQPDLSTPDEILAAAFAFRG